MVFQCPSCGKTLVAGTVTCQFCGSSTGQVGQALVKHVQKQRGPDASWQEICYWVLAWLWVANGVWGVLQAIQMVPVLGGFYGPLSSIQLLVGLGLLTQNDFIIWIAKLITYLSVIGAFMTILFSFLAPSGLVLAVGLIYGAVQMTLACFTIYIFGYMSD